MQSAFEKVLGGDRFSMNSLAQVIEPMLQGDKRLQPVLKKIAESLPAAENAYLLRVLLRHVFLIELVVPEVTTTRFRVRWYEQLKDDPRACSHKECQEIASDLLVELANSLLQDKAFREELTLFSAHGILPYEGPLDYKTVDPAKRIHFRGNLVWAADPRTVKTLKLRAFLTDATAHSHAAVLSKALDDKIKIKTYLTDRALTGAHKTNREKRWETHPESVQFATRRSCLEIERTLFLQLCSFEGFPQEVREALQKVGILSKKTVVYRCPITQNVMYFKDFEGELLHPKHGKASFQVGHLNPLKLSPDDEGKPEGYGHTADNIGWVSADGNRIQGHLSLSDTRALLQQIAKNYEAQGLV